MLSSATYYMFYEEKCNKLQQIKSTSFSRPRALSSNLSVTDPNSEVHSLKIRNYPNKILEINRTKYSKKSENIDLFVLISKNERGDEENGIYQKSH